MENGEEKSLIMPRFQAWLAGSIQLDREDRSQSSFGIGKRGPPHVSLELMLPVRHQERELQGPGDGHTDWGDGIL